MNAPAQTPLHSPIDATGRPKPVPSLIAHLAEISALRREYEAAVSERDEAELRLNRAETYVETLTIELKSLGVTV